MSARPAARSARVRPHKVRGRELEEVREADPDGRIVYHHRTVDTLGKMLRSGTITQAMHDTAKDFQAAFIVADLDPLRVPGTGRDPDLNDRQLHARRRVHKALQALRVGNAAGVGWSAGAPGAGAGDPGRGARDAGGALRLWRGPAGLLKEVKQVPIITVGARSSCGWRIQSDAIPSTFRRLHIF